jgi:hypothetical protein
MPKKIFQSRKVKPPQLRHSHAVLRTPPVELISDGIHGRRSRRARHRLKGQWYRSNGRLKVNGCCRHRLSGEEVGRGSEKGDEG